MKLVDKIKALFRRKPKVVEEPSEPTEMQARLIRNIEKERGEKNVNEKRQELKRVHSVLKNNVGCQYVYTDW